MWRRRKYWRRGWRNRSWRRKKGARRRLWRTRSWTRRGTVRRRRKWRVPRRRLRVAKFWDPAAKKKCTITGWFMGLVANWNKNMSCRMFRTNIFDERPQKKVIFTAGGMMLYTFSLRFLWNQHKLFQNFWSTSNDGFDLAKYVSTTFYLPPLRDNTYIFWWDVDYNKVTRQDFWKTAPSLLLAWKNKVIVRPMSQNNHKTRKVTIKPPATITNQWRYQGAWMDMGLFMWGLTIFDWTYPFSHTKDANRIPYVQHIPAWKVTSMSGAPPNGKTQTMYYASWRDTGEGNYIWYKTEINSKTPQDITGTMSGFKPLPEANDLPYWLTLWGQNDTFDFDDDSAKDLQQQGWAVIYWGEYQDEAHFRTITQRAAVQKVMWLLNRDALYQLSTAGAFIQMQNIMPLNIPILYKSRWVWGGASMNKQAIGTYVNFAPSQVAVRNPATIQRSIITPWDVDGHGILTEEAIKRFLQPSGGVDARRPLPIEEYTKEDEPYTSSASSAEESEEDEKGPQNQQELTKAIRRCRARLEREQHERHRLRQLFRSLIKQE
nr:ORF1 [Torque teno felis virus]